MRHIVLADDPEARERLFPFCLTRPLAEIRIGITTLAEKWAHFLGAGVGFSTAPYLSAKYSAQGRPDTLFIRSHLIPNPSLAAAMATLQKGQAMVQGETRIAWTGEPDPDRLQEISWAGPLQWLEHPFQIFQWNGQLIREDFSWVTAGRNSAPVSPTNHLTAPDQVFLEEGPRVEHAFLNATMGPIYVGKGAQIMEGAMIRGPFAMGTGSVVKMGAAIYGATSFGPFCRMGGEIKNSVVFGYSNKAHGGYLGDAVVGEWCNLGANTNCSNLKNNVREVKIWNEPGRTYVNAGTKCGLLMGDYSRSGISTMFNTGTVTGVSCNIFGGDFPPKFIPSFSWGGAERWMLYDLEKAVLDARAWKALKQMEMTREEEDILRSLFASGQTSTLKAVSL